MQLSPQQVAFKNEMQNGTSSVVLVAVAGSGKTTSIMSAVEVMSGQTALVAFNKAIADELKARLEEKGIGFRQAQAGTAHSYGFWAVRKAFGNVKVFEYKVRDIVEGMVKNDLDPLASYVGAVTDLVGLAKQRAIGVNTSIDDETEWLDLIMHFGLPFEADADTLGYLIGKAMDALRRSNRSTSIVDYNDMIYLPLVHNLRMWQFDNVMVDEAQDTNEARRLLYKKMLKARGRMVAVGDPHQAIYGFTGADANSLDLIERQYRAKRMPLTVTYRCPKNVVKFAQQWVSHIEAHEDNIDGEVASLGVSALLQQGFLRSDDAILCRNTAPLVKLAFTLIRNKIACKVEGRDIGNGLIKLAKRWKIATIAALRDKLAAYEDREVKKAREKRQEARAQSVMDVVATLYVIMDEATAAGEKSIEDVVSRIQAIFENDVRGVVVLSTIHKSKGREWNRVFWLFREQTCPSPWAKKQWELAQEHNLCYVAATRAKNTLVDVFNDLPEEA